MILPPKPVPVILLASSPFKATKRSAAGKRNATNYITGITKYSLYIPSYNDKGNDYYDNQK